MIDNDYLCILFINKDRKPTLEELKEQLMNQEPLISDEEAFLRHLMRTWNSDVE